MAAPKAAPQQPAPSSSKAPLIAIGVAAVVTIGGFAYLFSVWATNGTITPEQTLRLASAQYVAGNRIVAGNLAASIDLRDPKEELDAESLPPEELGEADLVGQEEIVFQTDDTADPEDELQKQWRSLREFLIGAGKFEKAGEDVSPRERRKGYESALPHLETARELGFPDGRESEGYRMMGVAAYHLGKYGIAADYMQRSIDIDLTLENELLPLLAESRALREQANLDQALASLQQYLAEQNLNTQRRSDSLKLQIGWLIDLGRYAEAHQAIQSASELITPDVERQEPWAMQTSDELVLLGAKVEVAKQLDAVERYAGQPAIAGIPIDRSDATSDSDRKKLLDTAATLASLQRETTPTLSARARLVAAKALLLAGEKDLALAEVTQVRQQRPFRDEGLEGGLAEMEILAFDKLGKDVLQTARYIVREIGQSRHLNFTARKEEAFLDRVGQVLTVLRTGGEYEAAADTAIAMTPIYGVPAALTEKGVAYQKWGEATLLEGVGPGEQISREAFESARFRFRAAGDAFAQAAKEQFDTPEYVNTLWSAIDAYQKGRHFSKSIQLLEDYLHYEQRMKQPRGLVAHGRALLADGRPDEAIDSLQTCIIEFPRDPMRYEARLLGAQAAADSRDYETAEQWLRDNLTDGELTPQSPVWRDSLFTLGELLYSESDLGIMEAQSLKPNEQVEALRKLSPRLSEAIRRLSESVDRYWPQPRAQSAAYLLARGQLLAAILPDTELQQSDVLDAAQRDLRQKANQYRQSALDRFASLVRFMDAQQHDGDLSDQQQAILRNSLLGQADTLKVMKRYVEAADTYRDMSLRYMNEPPALEALLGQSRMMQELGRNQEADLLIRQAVVVLGRIDQQWDDRFDEMTRFDRTDWEKYLNWMNNRVEVNAKTPVSTQ